MDRASSLDQPHIVLECCISAFIDMYTHVDTRIEVGNNMEFLEKQLIFNIC